MTGRRAVCPVPVDIPVQHDLKHSLRVVQETARHPEVLHLAVGDFGRPILRHPEDRSVREAIRLGDDELRPVGHQIVDQRQQGELPGGCSWRDFPP